MPIRIALASILVLTLSFRTGLAAIGQGSLLPGPQSVHPTQGAGFPASPMGERLAVSPPMTPHPAVVRVVVHEGQGQMSLGSGTLVSVRGQHGLVLTNWHVVSEARGSVLVIFPGGFRSGATVLLTDRDWDLAALAIWRPQVAPVPLAGQVPQPGDPLSIAGYGSGDYRLSAGQCTQYLSPGDGHPFELIEVSTGARQGDSGGPIFNDRGELAGVLFGSAWGRTSGSHCRRVQQFLTSASPRLDQLESESQWIAATHLPSDTKEPGGNQADSRWAAGKGTSSLQSVGDSPQSDVATEPWPRRAPVDSSTPSGVAASGNDTPPRTRRNAAILDQPWVSVTSSSRVLPSETSSQATGYASSGSSVDTGDEPDVFPSGSSAIQRSSPTAPERVSPLTWEELAGKTRGEQLKSLLAVLGVVSVLGHVFRLFGGGKSVEPQPTTPARASKRKQVSAS